MKYQRFLWATVSAFFFFAFGTAWAGDQPELLKKKVTKQSAPTAPALPTDLQPAPPTFEGKAVVKDEKGKYVPIKMPELGAGPGTIVPPDATMPPGVDIFVADGSETSININYDDRNNLVGMYNQYFSNFPLPHQPHANSTDGNGSWAQRTFPNGAIFTGYPYDPWVNAGNTGGEFFSTEIRYDMMPPSSPIRSHCIVSRSVNGGASFGLFFERVKAVFQDREMVDVDRTTTRGGGPGSANDGRVYLCYDDWGPVGAFVGSFLQVVSPGGVPVAEYQIADLVPPFEGNQMQPVADTGDGRLYIQSSAIGGGGVTSFAIFHELTNAGAGPNTIIKSSLSWSSAGQNLFGSGRWGVNGHRIDNHGYLDVDRSFGPRRGNLYFISNRNPNPGNTTLDQGDIHLAVSNDRAATWVAAGTGFIPTAAGKTQFMPMLDVDENGWIHVAYYQNDAGLVDGGVLNAGTANLYYTFSANGGLSWSTPLQVNNGGNAQNFEDPPPNRAAASYYLIGDYAQLHAAGTVVSTKAHILWTQYDKNRDQAPGNTKTRVFCTTMDPLVQTALGKLDVVFLLDVTGSTGALLPNWQLKMPTLVADIQAKYPLSRFGLATHVDFPFAPYGDPNLLSDEYAYRQQSALNGNPAPMLTALNLLTSKWGNDDPESQYEAIYQAMTGAGADLSNNANCTDPGDICPSNMGYVGNPIAFFHFTYPVLFHDRDVEPTYPFAGSVNVHGRTAAIAAVLAKPVIFFGLVTGPLPLAAGEVSTQTGAPYSEAAKAAQAVDPLTELARLTGGDVYDVGAVGLSTVGAAIDSALVVVTNKVCPALSYPCNLTFYFPVPDGFGDVEEGMRFDNMSATTQYLSSADVLLYNQPVNTNDTVSNCVVNVYSDAGGVPGALLASATIPNGVLLAGGWGPNGIISANADFSASNISFPPGASFHITTTVGLGDPGPVNILLDDGSCGANRWVEKDGAGWHIVNVVFPGNDENLHITANLCRPACTAAKGDMNADGNYTAADVVLELNCAFLGAGSCDPCFSDANCDGVVTAADVVLELNKVFLGIPLPC